MSHGQFSKNSFSATWPEGVRDLASKLMKNPFTVVVGSLDLKAVHTVTQKVVMCEEDNKKDEVCIVSLYFISYLQT